MEILINKDENAKSNFVLLVTSLLFVILLIFLVVAYPVLDSGITNSTLKEDSVFDYNFTQNVTYDPATETLNFSIFAITSSLHSSGDISDFDWISLNDTSGIMTINATRDNETGNFTISIRVLNTNEPPEGTTVASYFNVSAVNDAPNFANIGNQTFNISELFEYIVNVTDEENNIPYNLTINFTGCVVAEWSNRDCSTESGRELFNSSQYSFDTTLGVLNISFTPGKSDVGNFTINFTIYDNGTVTPLVANFSLSVNFTVLNSNSKPYFEYVCDNERNATEDSEFTCWINVSDIDETNNLTVSSNYSWFIFNDSNLSFVTKDTNITTNYNASVFVKFTANDSHVGNWSINITVNDTSANMGVNSTVFWFFVDNVEDGVSLDAVENLTIYEDAIIYVNATDNDLFVPDKSVKNETLTFASNLSWVNISSNLTPSDADYTTAKIEIDYDSVAGSGDANYTVRINVTDTANNTAEINFTIEILGDNAPSWNSTMTEVFLINEGSEAYFNLTQNVTDLDGDPINFSFSSDSSFPSFSINLTTGIINFTPTDSDVGYHNITINATDGKLNSLKSFNFTINNTPDSPLISFPVIATGAAVDGDSNVNASESNVTRIRINVQDDDLLIPAGQKDFYDEGFTVLLTIQGPNTNLFAFYFESTVANLSRYWNSPPFTPNKSDVGVYNVSVIFTDASERTASLSFNLTVLGTNHNPVMSNLGNQTSGINRNFYLDVNATDIEEVSESSGNLTFNISFLQGADFINSNESLFNTTSGIFNITFNSTQGGKYHVNLSVNDSSGLRDSEDFWFNVYDTPNVTSYNLSEVFNLQENVTSNLIFRANHSVLDNLTYEFYIGNEIVPRYNVSHSGNNTNLTWQFAPNFTDETYGLVENLTLTIYPSSSDLENATDFNFTQRWNLTINLSNAPVRFIGNIGTHQATYDTNITINLTRYLLDEDYNDVNYNQTVNFTITSNSSLTYITASVDSGWNVHLRSLIQTPFTEFLTINASDLNSTNNETLTSVLSNAIEIQFTTPSTTSTPASGGGGGTTIKIKYYSLKIITPGDLILYRDKKIIVPLIIKNSGQFSLSGINLSSKVSINNKDSSDVRVSLGQEYINELLYGEAVNVTMEIYTDTNKPGRYKVSVFANVTSPEIFDWGEFYIDMKEVNETEAGEKIIFTEKFIAENPECIELTELVNEAKKLYEDGDFVKSFEKATEVVEACKKSLSSGKEGLYKEGMAQKAFYYLVFSTLGVFILGFVIYIYKRARFNKQEVEDYV